MSLLSSFDFIILFFILGLVASWLKSDLEVPPQISQFLSIFILLSLGLKGGHEVKVAENLSNFLPTLLIGLGTCIAIPLVIFFSFRKNLGQANAAALAASYGSVSAVTFVTANAILENIGMSSSGYMVAIMALMEVPAIIIGIYLYQKFDNTHSSKNQNLLKSIFTTKSVILLLGGFVIGLIMNDISWKGIAPVVKDCLKGLLGIFLLDLGIQAQKQLRDASKHKFVALIIALFIPIIFGSIALIFAHLLGLASGDKILISVLAGSASYIAAPASIKSTIPTANLSLYLALPLAMTFPMNLIFGVHFYIFLNEILLGTSNIAIMLF